MIYYSIYVEAFNFAGSVTTNITLIKINDNIYKTGIIAYQLQKTDFPCDNPNDNMPIKTVTGIWNDIEDLICKETDNTAREYWLNKWGLTPKNSTYSWDFHFFGYFMANETGNYTFYLQIDYGGVEVKINQDVILDARKCQTDFSDIKSVNLFLTAGYHSVLINGYITDQDTDGSYLYPGRMEFRFHYSIPHKPKPIPIPFTYRIIIYII